jgi:hypothetical protein
MRRYRTGLSPSFYIRRQSYSRGIFGEDRFWRLTYSLINSRRTARRVLGRRARVWRSLYTATFVVRLIHKVLGFGPHFVSLEKLAPGQFVRIEAIDPRTLSPAERKRYKR